jgi:hypothetical protein
MPDTIITVAASPSLIDILPFITFPDQHSGAYVGGFDGFEVFRIDTAMDYIKQGVGAFAAQYSAWEESTRATGEVLGALVAFAGFGPKKISYGPKDPFTGVFVNSPAVDMINADITSNCGSLNHRGRVQTFEAFSNTVLDGIFNGQDFLTPQAQVGSFNYSWACNTNNGDRFVNVAVTNPISLNSLLLHGLDKLGIPNPNWSGPFSTVIQTISFQIPGGCYRQRGE